MSKVIRRAAQQGFMVSLILLAVSCSVTPPINTPAVTSVSIDQEDFSLAADETRQLTATVEITGSAAQTVTWKSSNEALARVSNTGLVTAVGEGQAAITATSTVDTSKSGSVTVTVTDEPMPTVVSVTINQGDQNLVVGGSVTLTTTVEVTGGAEQTVTWESSDDGVATVSNSGFVTAVAVGEATITAASTEDASKSDSVTVTVTGNSSEEFQVVLTPTSDDGWPGTFTLDQVITNGTIGEVTLSLTNTTQYCYGGDYGPESNVQLIDPFGEELRLDTSIEPPILPGETRVLEQFSWLPRIDQTTINISWVADPTNCSTESEEFQAVLTPTSDDGWPGTFTLDQVITNGTIGEVALNLTNTTQYCYGGNSGSEVNVQLIGPSGEEAWLYTTIEALIFPGETRALEQFSWLPRIDQTTINISWVANPLASCIR